MTEVVYICSYIAPGNWIPVAMTTWLKLLQQPVFI